jgi:hypothetical protein
MEMGRHGTTLLDLDTTVYKRCKLKLEDYIAKDPISNAWSPLPYLRTRIRDPNAARGRGSASLARKRILTATSPSLSAAPDGVFVCKLRFRLYIALASLTVWAR